MLRELLMSFLTGLGFFVASIFVCALGYSLYRALTWTVRRLGDAAPLVTLAIFGIVCMTLIGWMIRS